MVIASPLTSITPICGVCGTTNAHINVALRQVREAQLCVLRSSLVEIPDGLGLARRGQSDPDYLYLDAEPGTSSAQRL